MLRNAARLAALSLLLLSQTACGFHPVYGGVRASDGAASTAAGLNEVAIDNIPNREGQILRNFLIDRMYAKDRPAQPSYRLHVAIRYTEEDLGILANATATRSLVNMYGDYALTDAKGKEILKGTAHSIASYDKLTQLYGTLAAKQDVHERTLHEISEQIVNRLSLYFSERQ